MSNRTVRNEKLITKEISEGYDIQCVTCALYNGGNVCDGLTTNEAGITNTCKFYKDTKKWARISKPTISYIKKG